MRISKLRASTWVCALWIERETILDSIGTSSSILAVVMNRSTIAALNSRMRSSCSER